MGVSDGFWCMGLARTGFWCFCVYGILVSGVLCLRDMTGLEIIPHDTRDDDTTDILHPTIHPTGHATALPQHVVWWDLVLHSMAHPHSLILTPSSPVASLGLVTPPLVRSLLAGGRAPFGRPIPSSLPSHTEAVVVRTASSGRLCVCPSITIVSLLRRDVPRA